MRPFLLVLPGLLAVVSSLAGADWPQWRGPARDGISQESGLLKEWPSAGPKLLWQNREIGSGYATPSVVADRLYLLGNDGLEDEFVQALSSSDGKRVWRTRLGLVGNPKQQPTFPAARSTPTVDGDRLYVLGSDGDFACLDLKTGQIQWKHNLRTEFGGKPGAWAYAESPLVDGDTVLCTPGGAEATLVAFNKRNGEVRWKCAVPGGDEAAYSSALAAELAGVKQYVQFLQNGLAGVEASTGKLLWRYRKTVSQYKANIPTPVVSGGLVYSAGAGTGGGAVRIVSKDGGFEAEQAYFSPRLPAAIGGSLLVGSELYGTSNQGLVCADFKTGEIKWTDPSVGAGALCYADGRLYLSGETGDVALVAPSVAGYQEHGRFNPSDRPARKQQMEKAWAYPVVSQGKLYLRDQNVVWCYDVKAP